jgi:hypothetical protein
MSAFVLMKLVLFSGLSATLRSGGHAFANPQYSVIHGHCIALWESVPLGRTEQFLSVVRVSR